MSGGFDAKLSTFSKRDGKIVDIRERAFAFAVRVVKLYQYLETHAKPVVI